MIAFDVGANNGNDSMRLANEGYEVHAFEPAPNMVERLSALGRIRVIPMAVSDYNGTAPFHLAEQADQGTSSLLEFNEDLSAWGGRHDLHVTRTVEVPVIRLDTYMRAHRIKKLDYLHVDAQGADLFVLMGLGDLYDRVQQGMVEAASRPEVALYRDQPVAADVIAWLHRHGFGVTDEETQSNGNEVNLRFRR